jgi:hypothetical protein
MKVHSAMQMRIVMSMHIALHGDDSAHDHDSNTVVGFAFLTSVWSAQVRCNKRHTRPHASMLSKFRPFS